MGKINEPLKEYDIFLTPKFYVVRREKLPIKFAFQAKRLAPSILDELIEDKDNISYVVYKDSDEWVFIAYNLSSIYEYAKRASLDPDAGGDIYFAEQIRDKLDKPICISDNLALAVVDGYVTLLPRNLTDTECKEADISMLRATKAYASATRASSISPTQSYIIASAFVLMAALIFVEGIRYSKAAQKEADKIVDAADGDPILMSKISRENILNKYKKIDKQERQIRETLKNIGSLLGRDVELISFDSDQKGFRAVLNALNLSNIKRLEKRVAKRGFAYQKVGSKIIINGRWR